ncbi:hypothetical protein A3F02_02930 [Candidatus Curtissbacteria bacterium RIFCSPHIGHO2_12_FULL_38_9b]|uniref:EamA domain-containing protein n=2 Tax=Candidatus Curtissiibacteriota TaxID=1752717 RepID=A0A1F5GYI4_9BACT|nr:MAG: hypothetical protein A3A48_02685 [Candidatus Curtissbacteria bacterium RIFCSPLOWO2_01_FULL_37_9]OGD96990.1 MAG: hypothetical protein A3F02_02930 [Candidatus Curtissbacteria bacterium RIFCSPHIGHO2_12_FULL_38_9b]
MKIKPAFFFLIVSALIWGANAPIMKWALENIPLFSLAFLRFAIASLIALPFVYKKLKIQTKDWPKMILASFLAVNPHIPLFLWGLKFTFAINAAFIIATVPILTIFAANLFLKEKLTAKLFSAAAVAIVGLTFIIGPPIFKLGPKHLLGSILIFSGTLTWIGYEILSKKLFKVYKPQTITYHTIWIGTLTLFPFFLYELFQNPGWIGTIDHRGIMGIFYGAIMSSSIAYFMWQWGLSKLPVSEAGFFLYLDPISAVFFAIVLLGEKITFLYIIGAIFILFSVIFAEHHRKSHPFHNKN